MKTKTTFLALLALTLTLVVGCVVGIGASAEEVKPSIEVEYSNVAYNDMMHLVFTVKDAAAIPENATAGIIIWDKAFENYEVAKARYATFTARQDGSTIYYRSYGIAATEIDTKIYVSAGYLLNGEIVSTQTPIEYSIVDYLISRLNGEVTEVQSRLYYNVLAYGLASDAVLGGNPYTLIKAEGGYVGGFNRTFAVSNNATDTFTLRAQATNANGEYFIKWIDENGATVSTDRTYAVTPAKAGAHTYTAVFGAKALSPYKWAVGFDNLATGLIDFGTPDLTKAPTGAAYGSYSGTNYHTYAMELKPISGVSFTNYYTPLATKNDTTDKSKMYTYIFDDNGSYIIDKTDIYTVIENAKDDKAVKIQKTHDTTAWSTDYTPGLTGLTEITLDIGVEELYYDGAQTYLTFRINNGKNTENYRINLYSKYNSKNVYFYAEQTVSGVNDVNKFCADGKVSYFSFAPGETVSIKVVFNGKAETPYIDLYANGVYAGSMNCNMFKGYDDNVKKGTTIDYSKAQITFLGIGAVSSTKDVFFIDNVSFK